MKKMKKTTEAEAEQEVMIKSVTNLRVYVNMVYS